jgi:hypothetical protein
VVTANSTSVRLLIFDDELRSIRQAEYERLRVGCRELEYYEACRSEIGARLREKQLKTGFGRAYLKRRLQRK